MVKITLNTPSLMVPMEIEKGKLLRWIDEKGFGFIKPEKGGADIFIHILALKSMSRPPVVGDIIHYETSLDDKGKLRAINAKIEGVSQVLTVSPIDRKRKTQRARVKVNAGYDRNPFQGKTMCKAACSTEQVDARNVYWRYAPNHCVMNMICKLIGILDR